MILYQEPTVYIYAFKMSVEYLTKNLLAPFQ